MVLYTTPKTKMKWGNIKLQLALDNLNPNESMSKFLSDSYLMKTADVIMNFFSSHNTNDHT